MAQSGTKTTPLINAALQGDLFTVRALIESGAKLDSRSGEGLTALHYAIENGDVEIAISLIEAGANVNAKDRKGISVLMEAIKRDQREIVDALLSSGAELNATARSAVHRNALVIAAGYGRVDMIAKLVERGADVRENDSESLARAVYANQPEAASLLLQLGADPNSTRDSAGKTLLITAASQAYVDLVRILIQAGADIHAQDSSGRTALDKAIEEEHEEVVELLKQL